MKSFDTLASLTPERIVWAARQADRLPHFTWREIAPGDTILNVGTEVTRANEKYYRAGWPKPQWMSRSHEAPKEISKWLLKEDSKGSIGNKSIALNLRRFRSRIGSIFIDFDPREVAQLLENASRLGQSRALEFAPTTLLGTAHVTV